MSNHDATHISPDGRIRIDYESREMRMSHWVDEPRVCHAKSGRLIFSPQTPLVSGNHEWGDAGRFTLFLARYPDAGDTVTLHFDIDAETVALTEDGGGSSKVYPIAEAARLCDRAFAANRRAAMAHALFTPSKPSLPPDLWQRLKRTGLMLLLAIAMLIASLAAGYLLMG